MSTTKEEISHMSKDIKEESLQLQNEGQLTELKKAAAEFELQLEKSLAYSYQLRRKDAIAEFKHTFSGIGVIIGKVQQDMTQYFTKVIMEMESFTSSEQLIEKTAQATDSLGKIFRPSNGILNTPINPSSNAKIVNQTNKQSIKRFFTKPALNMSLATQLKIDTEKLTANFERIYDRWSNAKNKLSHTGGYRLVTDVLLEHLNNPLTFSIISDSVENFRKHFHEMGGDIFCLEFSCLCGSENIINKIYLSDSQKIKCLTLSENAIAYALSSGKEELAYCLAHKALNLGKTDPGNVSLYSFGNITASKKIREMFSNKNSFAPS